MQDLNTLIELLTKGRNIHISILDIDGILSTELTSIPLRKTIHSKPFCDVAKSTEAGLKRCLSCKRRANKKAVNGRTAFAGHCSFGIYEAATPVIRQGTVSAVVYVGNYVTDPRRSRALISRSARLTGVDEELLLSHLGECEHTTDVDEAFKIGEIVSDYILRLIKNSVPRKSSLHWLTLKMKQHAEEFYTSEILLKDLAMIYHKNEKYMGRIFKKEIGMSFDEYCITLRLARAEELLLGTSEKIIDIAMSLGFNNVSYFNRVFKNRYGVSPSEYRRKKAENNSVASNTVL